MQNIEVHFTDGTVLDGENVSVEESLTRVTIYDGPGLTSYTVIPLVNIQYYDVEEIKE